MIPPRLTSEKRYFSIFQSTDSLLSLSLSFDENFIIGIYQRSECCFVTETRLIDVFVSRRKDRFLLVAVSCLTIVVFDIAPCGYVGRDVCLSFFLWRKFRLIGRQRSSSSRMILYFLEVTCNVMILRSSKRNEFLTTEILLKVSRVGLAGFKNKSVGLFVAFQRT